MSAKTASTAPNPDDTEEKKDLGEDDGVRLKGNKSEDILEVFYQTKKAELKVKEKSLHQNKTVFGHVYTPSFFSFWTDLQTSITSIRSTV